MSRKSSKRGKARQQGGVSSRTRHQPITDLPTWLLAKIEDHKARWADGKCRTCMHAPTPTNGVQACMVAWKPDLVTCPGCSVLATVAKSNEENRRCDCCARVVADTEGDHLYSARVALAGIAYAFAVCAACRVHKMSRPA